MFWHVKLRHVPPSLLYRASLPGETDVRGGMQELLFCQQGLDLHKNRCRLHKVLGEPKLDLKGSNDSRVEPMNGTRVLQLRRRWLCKGYVLEDIDKQRKNQNIPLRGASRDFERF